MSKTREPANWLIYALGGGWGHLNRALALGRAAAPYANIHIVTNSSVCRAMAGLAQAIQLYPIAPDAGLAATSDQVRRLLTATPWDCVIIDTFPRGIGGELTDLLPRLRRPRVLVHRDLRPAYIQQKEIVPFVAEHYPLILVPGELGSPLLTALPQAVFTPPWVIRSRPQLPDPRTARSLLKVSGRHPVAVVLAGGRTEEQAWYGSVTQALIEHFPQAEIRCMAVACPPQCPPSHWLAYYPAMDCLVGADAVIGSGGYNTVSECRVLRRPLVARPFPRLYDRQAWRLKYARFQGATITPAYDLDSLLAAIEPFLQRPPGRRRQVVPPFINGVEQAVQEIRAIAQSLAPSPKW